MEPWLTGAVTSAAPFTFVEGIYALYHPGFDKYVDLWGNNGGDGEQNLKVAEGVWPYRLNKRFIIKKAQFNPAMYSIQPFLQNGYVCATRDWTQLETKSADKYSEFAEWDLKLSNDRTTVQIKGAYGSKYIYANENSNGGRVVLNDLATSWVFLRLPTANSIKTGAYYLTNKASFTCVDLNNGDPGDGVRVAAYEANPSNEGSRANRQWIIVPQVTKSGKTGLFNIINIRTMTFLICAGGNGSNTNVVGGPRQIEDEATGWSIVGTWNSDRFTQTVTFQQRRHYLNVENGRSNDGTLVHGYTEGGSDASQWFLDPVAPPVMSMCSWMSFVPDGTPYAQMSFPVAHQSSALWQWRKSENPHCQNTSIYEQLQIGVRQLDCRFDAVDSMAMAVHGMALQRETMGAIMQCIRAFLTQNPTEVVLFRPRWEPNNDKLGRDKTQFKQFYEVLMKELVPFGASVPEVFIGPDFDVWKSLSKEHRGKMALLVPPDDPANVVVYPVVSGKLFGCNTPGTDFFKSSGSNVLQSMEAYGVLKNDDKGQFQDWLAKKGGAFQFIYDSVLSSRVGTYTKLSLNASDWGFISLNPIDAASYINPRINGFLKGEITNNNGQQDMKQFKAPRSVGCIEMDYASDWGRGLCFTIVSYNPSLDKDAQGQSLRLLNLPDAAINSTRYMNPKRGSGGALDWWDCYSASHVVASRGTVEQIIAAVNASWPY